MSKLFRITQIPRANSFLAVALAILGLGLVARPAQAQFGNGFFGNRVGGVMVNTEGALVSLKDSDRIAVRDFFKKMHAPPAGELNKHVELRKFSLRKLEEAIRQANKPVVDDLPDELRFLGGIQRLQYILLYPDEHDIVLAGPGEGWKVAEDGNVVGVTTGRPVLRLEDLLIALRSVENARQGGISCSIDPTAEGRQRMDALLAQRLNYSSELLTSIKQALGPQKITITGVPADSHFARVLVSSDFYMKQIAMKLIDSPLKELPSFIDMLKRDNVALDNMMPRWWMECDYEPIARTDDGLGFELRGRGVKVLTEEEVADGQGQVAGTGKESPVARKWADLMTKHYDQLSQKTAAFGELRNVFDMCVIAALISKERLLEKADCQLPTLTSSGSLNFTSLEAPKTVATQTSSLKRGSSYIVTASGGVAITSWQAASKTEVRPEVGQIREKARPAATAGHPWWN